MDEETKNINPLENSIGVAQDTVPTMIKRVYWFQRRKDGQFIAIEGEKQASTYCYSKSYQQNFRYLGWSDGTTFVRITRSIKKIRSEDIAKKFKDSLAKFRADLGLKEGDPLPKGIELPEVSYDVAEHERGIYMQAFEAEKQAMLANPDKTKPRNFNVTDLQGNPMTSGMLPDLIKMMNR